MTLRIKLFVLLAGVIIFATTGVTAVALWREVVRGQQLLAREGAALASSVGGVATRWIGPDGPELGARQALSPTLERLLDAAPLDRAWIVDRSGRVVVCVERNGEACPDGVPTEFLPAEGPIDALTRLIHPEGIVTGAPILRGGQLVGAVRIEYQHDEVVGSARRLAYGSAIVAAFWIFFGDLLAAVFVRRITRPLTRVVDAAETLCASPRPPPPLCDVSGLELEVPSDPEVAELVRAFNRMSARLEERRLENQRLIESLEERVAQKTREVLRADRLATLGGIAAGFAHELGNSLNVVRGYTAVILRELPEDHPNRPDLDAVRREVLRAASLLERFLVFARARNVAAQAESLEPVLRETVEMMGPVAAEARVATSIEVEPNLPLVKADAELLRQAFLNLCVNAVQAMQPGGGTLTVRARRSGGGIQVEFQDTGPGIDPETLPHVFEPFYTTKANGTGLGLAIVRQAAEAHGGAVEVASEPGKGATFRMRLPAEEMTG